MADNVAFQSATLATPAAGTNVATDDAGAGGHVQVVKLAVSADGDASRLTATAADGLLVNLGANNDVTVTGTVTATDGGGSLTVDGTVTANAGAGPWPVTDNGGSLTVDDGGSSLTVDGTVAVSGTVTVDSELPAAAALADNAGNPTAPAVGAFNMVWDGATWDRAPGTSVDGLLVNLGANNDVTVTGTVTASDGGGSLTVDGTVTANAGAGPWPVTDNGGSLTVDNAGTFAVQAGQVAQDAAVSGNPVLAGLRASDAEPTAMSADGDAVYGWGDRSGRFVTAQKAATVTTSSVAGSATSVTLLAANAARVGATIYNDSTANLFVKLGATASTTSFWVKLLPDGYAEVPYGYTGVIDGIWASATGNARLGEVT